MTIEQKGGILLIGIMSVIILSAFGYAVSQYTVIAASAPAVGVYLADGLGRPLYCLCGAATGGCNDSCMSAFFEFSGRIYAAPPLNQSDFSYVSGSQIGHIAYRGAPLYYFRDDTRDGIYGDGYMGVWRLARP
jgi:predicted lipoprotein with Yx(FWY)xxD motif